MLLKVDYAHHSWSITYCTCHLYIVSLYIPQAKKITNKHIQKVTLSNEFHFTFQLLYMKLVERGEYYNNEGKEGGGGGEDIIVIPTYQISCIPLVVIIYLLIVNA